MGGHSYGYIARRWGFLHFWVMAHQTEVQALGYQTDGPSSRRDRRKRSGHGRTKTVDDEAAREMAPQSRVCSHQYGCDKMARVSQTADGELSGAMSLAVGGSRMSWYTVAGSRIAWPSGVAVGEDRWGWRAVLTSADAVPDSDVSLSS